MSELDGALLAFINRFAERSWTFDNLIVLISDTALAKEYLVLPLFWWAWFRRAEGNEQDRRTVILTLLAGFLAIVLARLLQLALPFLLRPLHTAGLQFIEPYSLPATVLSGWSSFPSDHASLFFCSRYRLMLDLPGNRSPCDTACRPHRLAAENLPWLSLPNGRGLPRHGGIGAMSLVWRSRSSWGVVVEPVLAWSRKSPQTFFPCFFLLTAELAHLFEDTRALAEGLWHILKPLLGR